MELVGRKDDRTWEGTTEESINVTLAPESTRTVRGTVVSAKVILPEQYMAVLTGQTPAVVTVAVGSGSLEGGRAVYSGARSSGTPGEERTEEENATA